MLRIFIFLVLLGLLINCNVNVTSPSEKNTQNESAETKDKTNISKDESNDVASKTSDKSDKNVEESAEPVELSKSAIQKMLDSQEVLYITGMDKKQTHYCDNKNVVIDGNDNDITLMGKCNILAVSGNDHKVWVDTVTRIIASGNDSTIIWKNGKNNKPPKINKSGFKNIVKREE